MIAADDPRHGTTRGYHAGCRQRCCAAANSRRAKTYKLARLRGETVSKPALGVQRRIQALMCLGWTASDIAHAGGWANRNMILGILKGQRGRPCTWVERSTFDRIARVYDELSMRLPATSMYVTRTKNIATSRGWLPPLAWDDIDNDPTPRRRADRPRRRAEVDHAIVERVLAGEVLDTTQAERREIMRRWLAQGRTERDLCTRMGWGEGRYVPAKAASAA